jgi:hypothetical protein
MLNEADRVMVWEKMLEAEVRAFYFGDLAANYSKQKQVITFLTFFLASGAAATLVGQLPSWVPLGLSLVSALTISYSLAFALDRKALTLSKLHSEWMQISIGYRNLWHYPEQDGASQELGNLLTRAAQASEIAALEAPYQPKRLDRWADKVYAPYQSAAV